MSAEPWQSGKFLISAGLKPLEERPVFQREEKLELYLKNKRAARSENLEKYYPQSVGLSQEELNLVAATLRSQLAKDLPELTFNTPDYYRDEVDYILSHIPEDFSVWKYDGEKEWLALIHLCSPNHWDAREKIGRNFFESHKPVPHIAPLVKASTKMFEQVQKRGSVERFAWGVATDNRLNHHPEPPPGIDPDEWKGRSFDPENPKLYIRKERQTLFPISDQMNGFTIKTTFTDISLLPAEELKLIGQCIESMDEEILNYKGLLHHKENILSWIHKLIVTA